MKHANVDIVQVEGKKSDEDEEEVKIRHATTYLETIIHFVKAGIGAGIFAMGEAMKNIGYVVGPVLTVLLSLILLYEQHILLQCATDVRKHYGLKKRTDYGETFQLALMANDKWKKHARLMKIITNLFLILTQLGFCAVYFVFIGNTMKNVMNFFGYEYEVRALISMALVPILMSSLITYLKFLAPLSGLAGIFMIFGMSISYYFITQDLPPLTERTMATITIGKLPLFFGTIIYVFEGIGIILPLQNEMKQPKNFSRPLGVLNMGVLILTALVICFGFMGYWKYGEEVASSLTVNFPTDDVLAQSLNILISCGVGLGYAIQFYIPIKILYPSLQQRMKVADAHPFVGEMTFRVIIVLITFAVAMLIPNVGLLISIIGAICSNSLALVFPVFIEYLVKTRGDSRMSTFDSIKNVLKLVLAVCGFLSGGLQIKFSNKLFYKCENG